MDFKALVLCCSIAVMHTHISETIQRQRQDGYLLAATPYCKDIGNDYCEIYLLFNK